MRKLLLCEQPIWKPLASGPSVSELHLSGTPSQTTFAVLHPCQPSRPTWKPTFSGRRFHDIFLSLVILCVQFLELLPALGISFFSSPACMCVCMEMYVWICMYENCMFQQVEGHSLFYEMSFLDNFCFYWIIFFLFLVSPACMWVWVNAVVVCVYAWCVYCKVPRAR